MGKTFLLTGSPGCGKTTLIRRVIDRLAVPAGGFYTAEIRQAGAREGFQIITLDGNQAVLAHIRFASQDRLGKYGLDLDALDEVAVASIEAAVEDERLVIIDEIGPMEIRSDLFRQAVSNALASDAVILGTIARKRDPFIDRVRALAQVTLFQVTPQNREELADVIVQQVGLALEDSALNV